MPDIPPRSGAPDQGASANAPAGPADAPPAAPRPLSLGAQRAAARAAAQAAAAQANRPGVERVTVEPPPPPPARQPKLVFVPPRPARAIWLTNWPTVACVLLAAFLVGMLFPLLGAPLLVLMPIAVGVAFLFATSRARSIRLEVDDAQLRVSAPNYGLSSRRSDIAVAVLVEQFVRSPLTPSTTDLILLDRPGRTLLMLSGLLWPPDYLERAASALSPIPIERVSGRQTAQSLALRYPAIGQRADRQRGPRPASGRAVLIILAVLLVAAMVISARMFLS